ncbi:MAG: DUF6261 family protein [Bacteroidota bacterium]
MINKLTRSSRVTEVSAVSTRIVAAYNKSNIKEDLQLKEIIAHLEIKSAELTQAIRRKAESNLEEKDEIRDNLLRSLNHLIGAYIYHPDTAFKNAAAEVDNVFEKYSLQITNENYASESSLINSLLEELKRPDLESSVNTLPECSVVISALENAQAGFEAARIIYEKEKAVNGPDKSATIISKTIIRYINNSLVGYLNAMIAIKHETYSMFSNTLIEVISDNNRVVKMRNRKTEEEVV